MPSFDVVSELDYHELTNAVDQAIRELESRFDFKGTDAKFTLNKNELDLEAPVDFQLKQMLDVLRLKLTKRGIDIACLEPGEPEIALNAASQQLVLRHGIDADSGRKLQRLIRDSKLKLQASIQGDQLRVTGKQRDDLQAGMALIRKAGLDRPLQFKNFRD